MKQKMISFLLAILSTTTFAQVVVKQVIVSGKMINANETTPKVLGFNFLNPFDKNRKSATVNQAMEFSIQEGMVFTQNMTIAYNDTFINLYVVPGDSVHLEIDAALLKKPNFEWLRITGSHSKISTQLNLLHYHLSKLPYHKYNYAMSVPSMLQAVKEDNERYLSAVKQYTQAHDTDPIVIDFIKRDIKFGISSWIADYVNEGHDSTSTKQERIALFKDPFFEFGNDANFVSMMYPYHLSNYLSWKVKSDHSVMAVTKAGQDSDALKLGVKLVLAEPASISRDYLLFSWLSSTVNQKPQLKSEMPSMRNYFTDPIFFKYLEFAVDRANIFKVKPTVVAQLKQFKANKLTVLKQVDILKFLSNKYPGKVIYLDIYATWCVPCLQEMEFAPALHQQFAGKNVVFVNLCLQSSEENWLKLIKTKPLHGENYFLDQDDDNKLLMGNFNLSGFPTYVLIDANGVVKTTSAARPSALPQLTKEIEALMK